MHNAGLHLWGRDCRPLLRPLRPVPSGRGDRGEPAQDRAAPLEPGQNTMSVNTPTRFTLHVFKTSLNEVQKNSFESLL